MKPELIKIPDIRDTVIQKNMLREFAISRYPQVDLIRLDRNATIVDPLYLESTSKRFMTPVPIYCLPDAEPTKKTLTKYGLEQERPVLFKVPTSFLSDIDYLYNSDVWMIGDLIRWGGDTYEIKDQVKAPDGYWATTNICMYYILGADFYRAGI